MKPNFALYLSSDGIRLLHRAADGWRRVGTVPVDAADIAGSLDDLRIKGEAIAPNAGHVKVIVPDSQIRFMELNTGKIGDADRRDAALRALDGATPYDVEELIVDIAAAGKTTYVAAIARETIAEADEFARGHGFVPVSFVAAPEEAPFPGEPYFGTGQGGPGKLRPPPDKVTDIGPAQPPAPLPPITAGSIDIPDEEGKTPPAPEVEETAQRHVGKASKEPIPSFSSRRGKYGDTARPSSAAEDDLANLAGRSLDPLPDAAQGRFLSRRRRQRDTAFDADTATQVTTETPQDQAPELDTPPADTPLSVPPAPRTPEDEAKRLTVFGARDAVADPPAPPVRRLGLMASVALVLVLVLIAIWAAFFSDFRVSRWFEQDAATGTVALTGPAPAVPDVAPITPPPALETATLTDEDAAVLDALRAPVAEPEPEPDPPPELTAEEAEARYAVTGIWPRAPEIAPPADTVDLGDLYLTSIDPVSPARDAFALPSQTDLDTDRALDPVASPAAAGLRFDLDARGLVVATPDGALSPDGVMVFLGRPPAVPPETPQRSDRSDVQATSERIALQNRRPRPRPDNLAERTERSQLGGLTRSELAEYRPRLRPESAQPDVAPEAPPTAQAVAVSLRPDPRPGNFTRIVARAEQSTVTSDADPEPRATPQVTRPSIPTSASVAREATVRNALNLNRVNLIGVYGKPSERRALVRLSNGRYRKVKVGDRIDGGRVSAIGDAELRYQKGGRNIVLTMPKT